MRIELKNYDVTELSSEEQEELDGGLLLALAANIVGLGIMAAAGAAIYGSFEAGSNQAC